MNKPPLFPLISVSKKGGLDLIPNANSISKVSALSLIDTSVFDDITLYDANDMEWSYTPFADNYRNTWLVKFLAKTIYNPNYEIEIIWKQKGSYQIDKLKNKLNNCVDMDDDIITQFEEAEVIKCEINKATNFNDIIFVLNKYVFAVNEEQIWKEHQK